jgi:hypothetical protein
MLQLLIRLLLGAVLLPLIGAAFLLFCLVAVCSDRQLVRRCRLRLHKWAFGEPRPAEACVSAPE